MNAPGYRPDSYRDLVHALACRSPHANMLSARETPRVCAVIDRVMREELALDWSPEVADFALFCWHGNNSRTGSARRAARLRTILYWCFGHRYGERFGKRVYTIVEGLQRTTVLETQRAFGKKTDELAEFCRAAIDY